MTDNAAFHVVTVGWDRALIEGVANRTAAKSGQCFSHLVHPSYTREEWSRQLAQPGIHFFRDNLRDQLLAADHQLLASLETDGVPTLHNMILGDRIVAKLEYRDALRYATFLARRLFDVFGNLKPSAVIASFDALHSGISLAVARRMGIPWFALNFSVIPPGLACFCDGMSPAARVQVRLPPLHDRHALAEDVLAQFENRSIQANAYIAPPPPPLAETFLRLPKRAAVFVRTLRNSRKRRFLQFTEGRARHHVRTALRQMHDARRARKALARISTIAGPPAEPFVLFGLHMQPESSIDVWAPFFSDQMWVIELLSRAVPPTHKLLIKIHKSDVSNHSGERLGRMCSLPGVQLVRPFADTRSFIERADLVISIQGTMGLEAALLGKPVIMLGDSPVTLFPSARRVGALTDLPRLIRDQLVRPRPSRADIVSAYVEYLSPFLPASRNNWATKRSEHEIDGYVELFKALQAHLTPRARACDP